MALAYGMKLESQLKPVTLYGYTARFLADNITIALFVITVWLLFWMKTSVLKLMMDTAQQILKR